MRRKKLLAGILTAVLLVGSISPAGVMGAEVPEEVQTEQVVLTDEAEIQREKEEAVTAEEDVKSAEADANGFVIEDGVLTDYTGDGGDVTIPEGVTSIGKHAFENCTNLTSITIPDSVTSIGDYAFFYCTSLTDITIPDSVTSIGNHTFYDCISLTSITIPDNVMSIGDYAFCNCSNLTSITIPDGVTSIGKHVFTDCIRLIEIKVSEGNENYISENGILYNVDKSTLIKCPGGKTGEVIIPNSVTSIGDYAFTDCTRLTEIKVSEGNKNYTSENGILYSVDKSILIRCPGGKIDEVIIPDNVTSIEDYAFKGCSGLTSITISDGVTSIGDYAFKGCSGLTSITIPDGVTSIESSTFNDCRGLISITIPDNVTSIGSSAFCNCSSLTSIIIPDNVIRIAEFAFSGCSSLTAITIPDGVTSIEISTFYNCSSLTSITIPDNVASIGTSSFSGCSSLTSITIPDNVICIAGNTFYKCSSLTSITIPDSVIRIENYAFSGCSSLTSIAIPDSVMSIENSSFSGCSSLISITILDSVTSIGDYAFRECSEDLIIHCVRDSYAETYAKDNNIRYRYIGEKNTQTITAGDNITKTFGDRVFSIGAVTDGDGTLSYVSDNEAVVKVDSEGTITLVGAGTVHITITASETDTYKAAEKVITITVEKKAQTITASDIAKTLGETAFPLNAAVDGDGILTYVSDNPSVAAIAENGTVTLVSEGTAHITIKVAETANYKAAEKVITVTVKPAETPDKEPEKNKQTITAKNITKTYGDKAFSLGAKTNGGGKLTYQVLNTKIATINKKGKVTIKGCGRTQIKITAAANGDYQAATKTITLTVKPKKLNLTSVKSTKSKAVTVKWKQDKKAKGYIVECSTDKKFKKNVKMVTISKNSTVSKTVTKLKGGKTYYVRACAYTTADGKKIKGSYSKVMSIKVKK